MFYIGLFSNFNLSIAIVLSLTSFKTSFVKRHTISYSIKNP